jgi:hypothetical protein
MVVESSQEALVTAYADAMERLRASTVEVTWTSRTGTSLATDVVLVPMAHGGHLFGLHFVTPHAP